MRLNAPLIFLLPLAGCGPSAMPDSHNSHGQSGRYVYSAANDNFPPVLVDTQTGCVWQLGLTNAPKDALLYLNPAGILGKDGVEPNMACRDTPQAAEIEKAAEK